MPGEVAGRQPRGKRPSHLLCRLIAVGEQDPHHRQASGPTREEHSPLPASTAFSLFFVEKRERWTGRRLSAALRGPGPAGAASGLDRFPPAFRSKARERPEAGQRNKQQAVETPAPAPAAHEWGRTGATRTPVQLRSRRSPGRRWADCAEGQARGPRGPGAEVRGSDPSPRPGRPPSDSGRQRQGHRAAQRASAASRRQATGAN